MSRYVVVMAGGSGTRFWPASRNLRPKQLLAIGPDPELSLLAATVQRLEVLVPAERILIATGKHLLAATRAALPQLPPENFLGEPVARNTAPCIGWAAAVVQRRDPKAVIAVLPSDHHIGAPASFRAVLEQAFAAAEAGAIVTVGLEPTRPETGYGYIERGAAVGGGAFDVVRFVEKPDRARAEAYLAAGNYLWNSGMFFFPVGKMLDAVRAHLPELSTALEAIDLAAMEGPAADEAAVAEWFPRMPSVSIDYGVMERETGLLVVPGSFHWSDLGSWESAWELSDKDDAGNATKGGVMVLNGERNLVQDLRTGGGHRTVAVVGVTDLCVVVTDDAVLVIPREMSQDVRLVVDQLKNNGPKELL